LLGKWELKGDNCRTNNEPCKKEPPLREKYKMVSMQRCLLKKYYRWVKFEGWGSVRHSAVDGK